MLHGMQKVRGSNPLSSTIFRMPVRGKSAKLLALGHGRPGQTLSFTSPRYMQKVRVRTSQVSQDDDFAEDADDDTCVPQVRLGSVTRSVVSLHVRVGGAGDGNLDTIVTRFAR